MVPDTARLTKTVALVDELLLTGRYSDLERLSGGRRLKAEEMKQAVDDHPEELARRLTYDLEDGAVVHIRGSAPAAWSVCLDLWRSDGGRSDLTVELTLTDADTDLYRVEIDGIHVL